VEEVVPTYQPAEETENETAVSPERRVNQGNTVLV
jgi:hypothetical protein